MHSTVLSFAALKKKRAADTAARLRDEALRLRRRLREVCGMHAIESLHADGIDFSGVDPAEIEAMKLTNIIVWLEEEAKRVREELDELEASMQQRGLTQVLPSRLL